MHTENQLFLHPPSEYRGKAFWAWNDEIEAQELCRQIDIFRQMGLGGFFIHARVGLKTPYLSDRWFELVKAAVHYAEKTGLKVWLYDEDRWPSGSAGGLATKDPAYRMRGLKVTRISDTESFAWPTGNTAAYVFMVEFDHDEIIRYERIHQQAFKANRFSGHIELLVFEPVILDSHSWYNDCAYLDTLDPGAVNTFITLTHERYQASLGDQFGGVIQGIFTDEPFCGKLFRKIITDNDSDWLVPWTGSLPWIFGQAYGYDILDHLPVLAYNSSDPSAGQPRYHYHCCRSRMFARAFMETIGQWCRDHRLPLTGHVVDEEPVSHTISLVGSAMQCYRHMQIPGIDNLTAHDYEFIAAKQCSSVAHQTGRKWLLSEMYGCTGWDTTFSTYKHIGDWQAVLGVTVRCLHLSWYSMAGEAKRDYPASIHFQSPWWNYFHYLEDYFARLNVMLTSGRPVCRLAVLHPLESFYMHMNRHWSESETIKHMDHSLNNLVRYILGRHLDFDFIDEELLSDWQSGIDHHDACTGMTVGEMQYRAVLVPPITTIRSTTLDQLERFADQGGKVVILEPGPVMVDGAVSGRFASFMEKCTVVNDMKRLPAELEKPCQPVHITDESNHEITDIFCQLRHDNNQRILFLVNLNRHQRYGQTGISLAIPPDESIAVELCEPGSGTIATLPHHWHNELLTFHIDIEPAGSKLVIIGPPSAKQDVVIRGDNMPASDHPVDISEWQFDLDDDNVVVLDYPACTLENEGTVIYSSRPQEILRLDHELRDVLNMPQRGGQMAQPWSQPPARPETPGKVITLDYHFHIQDIPTSPIFLALEQPDRWTIYINGKVPDKPTDESWWVDPAIRRIPIDVNLLRQGNNHLRLQGPFSEDTDLEIVYLLGRFGVSLNGRNVHIHQLQPYLRPGDWCRQGLPFYSGNVTYHGQFDFNCKKDRRYLLQFDEPAATLITVRLNGRNERLTFCPPWQIDITEIVQTGSNQIDITVFGSRRNSFGPLHFTPGSPRYVSPNCYRYNPGFWQDDYKLVAYGLMAQPRILELA